MKEEETALLNNVKQESKNKESTKKNEASKSRPAHKNSTVKFLLIGSSFILFIAVVFKFSTQYDKWVFEVKAPNTHDGTKFLKIKNVPDIESKKHKRIVAVGDLHGDFRNFTTKYSKYQEDFPDGKAD